MKILVTNDDGLSSEGIKILADVLSRHHTVWVIAPHCNRSGVSHGLTMSDPLRFKEEAERQYSCSGLPADCSHSGALGIMSEMPDVVVSGINRGANLGTDIVYSGTAAAARQAAFAGIPGIAVSLVCDTENWIWEPLASFVLKNLELLCNLCEKDVFVNINAPSALSWQGVKMTGISHRSYKDGIIVHDAPDGCKYSFLQGGHIETHGDGNSDWDAVQSGYISISRVYAQPVLAPNPCDFTPSFLL